MRKKIAGAVVAACVAIQPALSHAFLGAVVSAADKAAEKAHRRFMEIKIVAQITHMKENIDQSKRYYAYVASINKGGGITGLLKSSGKEVFAREMYRMDSGFFNTYSTGTKVQGVVQGIDEKATGAFLKTTRLNKLAGEEAKKADEIEAQAPTLNPQAVGQAQLMATASLIREVAITNAHLANLLEMETARFQKESKLEAERFAAFEEWKESVERTRRAGTRK